LLYIVLESSKPWIFKPWLWAKLGLQGPNNWLTEQCQNVENVVLEICKKEIKKVTNVNYLALAVIKFICLYPL